MLGSTRKNRQLVGKLHAGCGSVARVEGNFRMKRDTFFKLCSELRPYIERQTTNTYANPLMWKNKLLSHYIICLMRDAYEKHNAFGVSRASTSIILGRVTQAISLHMGPKYISLPKTEEDVKAKVTNFFSAMVYLGVWVPLTELT